MAESVGAQLGEKLQKHLKFQWSGGGAQGLPPTVVHGFDVRLLIDVCKAVIAAEETNRLSSQQKHIAKQAHVILNASAKAGKVENLAAAVSLHFMYYNFARVHQTLRVTPAMEAGVTDHVWTLEEIAGLLPEREPGKRGPYKKRRED